MDIYVDNLTYIHEVTFLKRNVVGFSILNLFLKKIRCDKIIIGMHYNNLMRPLLSFKKREFIPSDQ